MHPEKAHDIRYLASPKLAAVQGVGHAFPLRSGDITEPIENLAARMIESFNLKALLMAMQVHGTDVLVYDGEFTGAKGLWNRHFDAFVTSTPGLAVGVRTADCVPVLMAAPGKAVGAAHGGWKGLLNGVLENTVKAMRDNYGADPSDIVAAIGPHIRACCYEVGPEVSEAFARRFGESVLKPGKKDRPHLDLEEAAAMALRDAGLKDDNIDTLGKCTHCLPEWFHSYRREGKPNGRMLSFIHLDRGRE